MGELAQFGDEHEEQALNDPYYTEKVWYGMQPEDGGLTQSDLDELAWRMQHNREMDEQLDMSMDQKRLEFAKWLLEHGRIGEWPVGDQTVTPLKKRRAFRKMGSLTARIMEPYLELGPDDEPVA